MRGFARRTKINDSSGEEAQREAQFRASNEASLMMICVADDIRACEDARKVPSAKEKSLPGSVVACALSVAAAAHKIR